ncbi:MAG: thioredoxin family protein [Rhodospirillaceae bacterium]|nr:thioredoxin family protein [Rhodospirillaceae bacterium]
MAGVLAAAFWLAAGAALAQDAAPAPDTARTDNVTARLISERIALVPGRTAWVALHLTIRPGWHTYWLNPGDAGEKTEIAWTLPPGYKAGAIEWPPPQRLIEPGNIAIYGYTGTATHLVRIDVPADAKPGERIRLAADVRWLVCEKICLPEEAKLSLALPVQAPPAAGDVPVDGRWADAFDKARAALPKPSPWPARFALDGKTITLTLEGAAIDPARLESAEFFPAQDGAIVAAAPQTLRRTGNDTALVMPAASRAATFKTLSGVLILKEKLENGTVTQVFAIAAQPGAAQPGAARAAAAAPAFSLGWAMLLAMAGGIILNLMPCVFPILSMKALSFAAHGGSGRMGGHGLAYTGGVLALFAGIGAVLIALKGAGAEIGWGFQLQEPIFVMLMAYIMFVIGLNLAGLFEFGGRFAGIGSGLAARKGHVGAFFTGALAAVVATPCTAPFMGAAVGYAVTQPAPYAMAVMLALGFGMALPFLVLSYSPALLRRLPKPGAWMERFRQFLAFPMFATAAWLTWVLSLQAGDGALLGALAGAVLIAFAIWLWQAARGARVATRRVAAAVSVLALAGAGAMVAWAQQGAASPEAGKSSDTRWAAFDAERLATLRREGKPVFVNYTAAWCVTCLVNEKVVLRQEAVWAAFARKGVVTMKADWTRRDPAITRALAELGRNGVPVYALYAPGAEKPVLLPQILTESAVLDPLGLLPDRPAPQRAGQ